MQPNFPLPEIIAEPNFARMPPGNDDLGSAEFATAYRRLERSIMSLTELSLPSPSFLAGLTAASALDMSDSLLAGGHAGSAIGEASGAGPSLGSDDYRRQPDPNSTPAGNQPPGLL
jgi:hypothetical protein